MNLKDIVEDVSKMNEMKIRNNTDLKFMREITSILNRSPLHAEFDEKNGSIKVYRQKNDSYYVKLLYRHKADDEELEYTLKQYSFLHK